METQTEEIRYLEDYLKYTGWGLYYKFVIGVACLCNFARGFTFVAIAYTVALSSCDQILIDEINALRIFTCLLVGSAIGSLITSSLSDRYGRKRYLSYSLLCLFFSSFTVSFAYNIYVVIGAVVILGVGLETNAIQMRLLVVEILGKEKRGFYVTFCNMFWALGYVITTFFIILLETSTFIYQEISPNKLTSWRVMFAVCGGVNLLLACICAIIEESPRFYLYTGRNYLAYLLLKQLFAINNSSFAENFKVKEDDLKNLIKSYDLYYLEPESFLQISKKLFWRFWNSLKLIFSKRFCQITWLLILLKSAFIIIGLFQMNILLAKELVLRNQNITYEEYRTLDFVYPVRQPFLYMSEEELSTSRTICEQDKYNSFFYTYIVFLGFAIIPGQMLTMLIVDRMGRKFILFIGLLLASCSFIIMGFIEPKVVQAIAVCITIASLGGVITTITLINLELYPTAIRATANAVTSFPGFLLAAIFINLIIIDHQMFNIVLGILYFCLSVFACFLPEFKGRPIEE